MKPIPFLTEEEIQKLQEVEANSSKEQKKTAEQIEAIYTSGQNILVSASAGSGKTFVMAERILDQLARGVEISQLFISTFTVKAATELKERLEKKISQQIQETDDVELKHHLGQARFLEKLDPADGKRLVGEKLKQAWFEKIREELNR